MNIGAMKILQKELATDGHYSGPINGKRDADTQAAIEAIIDARSDELTGDPGSWSAKRKSVACLQLACHDRDIAVGPIDGLWGPQTDNGYDELIALQETGARPPPWRDPPSSDANPNGWPAENEASLRSAYGAPGEVSLVRVPCPWTLSLAWDPRKKTQSITCHEKVSESLGRILRRVHEEYGDAEIKRLRLNLYGGSYNVRRKRGGTSWSTHAWGIAIDWDPGRNKLKWGRDRASLSKPDYETWWRIWEDEGWVSLGRERNFDWMHVQAAKP